MNANRIIVWVFEFRRLLLWTVGRLISDSLITTWMCGKSRKHKHSHQVCSFFSFLVSLSPPPWPPFFSHLSPSPPLCPFFRPSSLFLRYVTWYFRMPAAGRAEKTLTAGGLMVLCCGLETIQREKEGEGSFFFLVVTVGVGLELRWWRKMEGTKVELTSLQLSIQPTLQQTANQLAGCHIPDLPAGGTHTERQDTNVMHCTANGLTILLIFNPVTELLQNYRH